MNASERFFKKNIDTNCIVNPFYPNCSSNDRKGKIGQMLKFTFPSLSKELVADLPAFDPEDFSRQFKVVGAIEYIEWDGGANDEIILTFNISQRNKALLQEALNSVTQQIDIEAGWVIYDYEYLENKYFKRLYTDKKPLNLLIGNQAQVYIAEDPSRTFEGPMTFMSTISLIPNCDAGEQNLYFAFSPSGTKFSQQIGELEAISNILLYKLYYPLWKILHRLNNLSGFNKIWV